jgi:hypothetical protein
MIQQILIGWENYVVLYVVSTFFYLIGLNGRGIPWLIKKHQMGKRTID